MAANNEKRTSTIILDGKQPARTIKDLSADIKVLGNHLRKLDTDSEAFRSGAKKMKELRNELGQANQQMRNMTSAWSKFWQVAKATAAGVFLGNIITNLTGMVTRVIPELIKRNAELSDSYADIRKTTGLTEDQVKSLDATLSSFNTRTSKKELRELAVEAGRLGIEGVNNIAGFVKAADQIKVALGDDLGSDTAANIRVVGKLAEQFKIAEKEGVSFEQAMLKAGSAINELSASGSAQAEYLINFTKRVSGVANTAELSIDTILAYAATLDEAGQNVEVSATTINKVLVDMFTDTATYAGIAGVGVKEFTDTLNKDANEAFILFLKGLNSNSGGLTELATKLQDADLEGSRATAVLSALAANTDKLAEKQEISNKALSEGTSLTNEFNIKNNNLAGTVDKIGKKLASVWLNSGLREGITKMVNLFGDWLGINEKVSEQMEKELVQTKVLFNRAMQLNTPQEERVKIIRELKIQYPKYLENLDEELATNEELEIALGKVNAQLLNRIIIQKEQEALEENLGKQGDAIRKQNEAEIELLTRMEKAAAKYGLTLDRTLAPLEQYKDLVRQIDEAKLGFETNKYFEAGAKAASEMSRQQNILNRLQEEENKLLQQKDALMKKLGIDASSTTAPGVGDGDDKDDESGGSKTPFIPSEKEIDAKLERIKESYIKFLEDIKALDREHELGLMTKDEAEIARINDKYDAELARLREFYDSKIIAEDEYFQVYKEIEALRTEELIAIQKDRDEKFLEQKKEFEEEVDNLGKSDREKEIAAVNKKYDKLIKLAESYGLDTSELIRLRNIEIDEINDYYDSLETKREKDQRDRILQIRQNFFEALVGFINSFSGAQAKYAEFERGLAFFQLAVSQVQAVANALQTSTSPTPDNIATGGLSGLAKFAVISTAILKTVTGLRALMSGQTVPSSPSIKFERGGFMTFGPMHAEGGMPIINPLNGQKQAEIQGGEAVLSRETVANNYSVVKQLIEQSTSRAGARIPQFNYGGMVGAAESIGKVKTDSNSIDVAGFTKAVTMFVQATENLEAKVVFTRDLIQTIDKNIQEQHKNSSKMYGKNNNGRNYRVSLFPFPMFFED